uniref:Putative conserved secreted protein n=1 Tax=Nyssomyia neivai TaxID=330878 RepID=A0A1L8DNX1_9DIPT
MSVPKLFFFILLIGAATALQCYTCNSDEIGDDCIGNTAKWSITKCPDGEKVCYVRLTRATLNSTTGFAERGCESTMNFCKNWFRILFPTGVHSCYVCNSSKCNEINALDIKESSSSRSSLNLYLLILTFLPVLKKISS